LVARAWFVMCCEHSANGVFVQVQPESHVDLLGNAWTAKARVTLLHFDDRFDDFP